LDDQKDLTVAIFLHRLRTKNACKTFNAVNKRDVTTRHELK
jgi:hypothetical protein